MMLNSGQNYQVVELWDVLGVAQVRENIVAIRVSPNGRLNHDIRRYIEKCVK